MKYSPIKYVKKVITKISYKIIKAESSIHTFLFKLKYVRILKNVESGRNLRINQKVVINGPGKVFIGDNVTFGYPFAPFFKKHYILISTRYNSSKLTIGNNCILSNNNQFVIVRDINIGDKTMSGHNTEFIDSDMHSIDPLHRHTGSDIEGEGRFIKIENNVMIGSNVLVGPDIVIGENSVVGMGSVIKRRKFPKNSVIVGNPGRAVKII